MEFELRSILIIMYWAWSIKNYGDRIKNLHALLHRHLQKYQRIATLNIHRFRIPSELDKPPILCLLGQVRRK
jgi:hypothetical protein